MLKVMIRTAMVGAVLTFAQALSVSATWAGCDFEHPRKAKLFQADLVQAFVSCGNPGANVPNTTSASGVPGCTPPETFNQQDGTPVNGWQWDERRSIGRIEFREFQGNFGGNSRDVKVKMRLRHILDGAGLPANGSGTITSIARTTLEDTVVTAPGMGTDMTFIDFPAPFPFGMTDGKATVNFPPQAGVIIGMREPLPGCTSLEILSLMILDPNGNPFAVPGVFLKDN